MKMEKIAFVVQRYGLDINGGAEYHCRVLAEHMTSRYQVDVLTSCAREYTPWDDYYDEGIEEINQVQVHRFSVDRIRDIFRFRDLTDKEKKNDENSEEEWISELGPYCPSCIAYLKEHGLEYKAIIFFTYAYYLTFMGLKLKLPNAILLPTAHDEPNIYLPIYRRMFQWPAAYLYNSLEERQFLYSKFDTQSKPSRLTCVGIDIPEDLQDMLPQNLKEYKDNYIVYLGRISAGKNYKELNRYFVEYKLRNPSTLKMVVVGKADEGMKIRHSKDIIYTGFVTEEEKGAVLQNAKFLVMPSKYESLSLVILESMAAGRPVLVNGRCEVLKGQCIRSNAGLYYTNYFEFEAAINFMLNHHEAYKQMCENGRQFVKNTYDWNKIVMEVSNLIEEFGSKSFA